MVQHPKVTILWAIHGLETAVAHLGDGALERRVRDRRQELHIVTHGGVSAVSTSPG
jgi:hypothetical protein